MRIFFTLSTWKLASSQNTENILYYVKSRGNENSYVFNYVYDKLKKPRKASDHQWNKKLGRAERIRNEDGKILYFDVWENKADNYLNLNTIKIKINGEYFYLDIHDDREGSFIEVPALRGTEKENYVTQKPEAILQRN